MSLYHAKWSYWKFSTRIDCKYSKKKKKKKKMVAARAWKYAIIAYISLET